MEKLQITELSSKTNEKEALKCKQTSQDLVMTSSITSSLASPVDSGVQLLDSESSEIMSVMSNSGMGCDIIPNLDDKEQLKKENADKLMTKSDIANQNIHQYNLGNLSKSVPNYFDRFDLLEKRDFSKSLSDDVFEMEHPIKQKEADLMNISLNSYELLDYTQQNRELSPENTDQMHISMSEEVNENMKITLINQDNITLPIIEDVPNEFIKPVEEQIVFRRQRKKKSKSDTPKKRVSFHEDILNSTKIDDIHINHGFVTIEPDVSLSFFQRGFLKKPDVVKGRYSWAAEGDAPYYEKPTEREIKSDIYQPRFSSTSSSSTGSSSSSIDEEEDEVIKKEPTLKQPKSSCLKKTDRKKIDTNIVEEKIKKRSEINLLDANIFGSLKNILNFSTSVPLMAERGVPEGQEDVTVYSTSHDVANRRKSFNNFTFRGFESIEPAIAPLPQKIDKLNLAKTNLKLTKSEGFYPNYPSNQTLPSNIIICDSNVYEHKGISYSYEYDKFQKSFEKENKPKSSTVYQMILKEFNFFRKKAKESKQEEFEIIHSTPTKRDSIEEVEEIEVTKTPKTPSTTTATTKFDWSDTDTISDLSENHNSRHLNSPKRKISRNNHYSVSPFNISVKSESELKIKPSSSKSSLINRFLRNVTLKKMLDVKAQNKQKGSNNYLGLYVKHVDYHYQGQDDVDKALEEEVKSGRMGKRNFADAFDRKLLMHFRKEIFRSKVEKLLKVFPVRSAYATNGESKPLLAILTNTTIYIAGYKANKSCYCNHFVLPYTELNTILIGPNSQTLHLSNNDRDMQCIITTGCANITSDLVGQIEMAMRQDSNKPKLLAVKQLSMRDMVNLRRAICKQTAVDKDEEYFFYSIVNMQDFSADNQDTTPMGPNKEGPLMFKTNDAEARWETAYFILKAGVLYMLSSASQRVPLRVFPLINGACQGARRVFNYPRPYTFQLIIDGRCLYLAAPDEYVASEWLQGLIHAASSSTCASKEKNLTQSCSLLMTSDHILTVREAFPCTITSLLPAGRQHQPIKGAQALSCAAISDLVAFRLPSAEQSWCILEFSCREVHECSGDWILYFVTNNELENFISTLEMLWAYCNENGDSFPLSTIPETDPLSKKCVDIYTQLRNSWPASSVFLQFM